MRGADTNVCCQCDARSALRMGRPVGSLKVFFRRDEHGASTRRGKELSRPLCVHFVERLRVCMHVQLNDLPVPCLHVCTVEGFGMCPFCVGVFARGWDFPFLCHHLAYAMLTCSNGGGFHWVTRGLGVGSPLCASVWFVPCQGHAM